MSTPLEADAGRLNGWKEIALHLGKGTRTVQRWEKLYSLPVHRIGREGGEIVFAFRDEIDRWVAEAERERPANGESSPVERRTVAGPGPTGRGLRWAAVTAVLILVAAVLVALPSLRRQAASGGTAGAGAARTPGRQPAGWRLASESLTVFDSAGAPLFEHRFGFPLVRNSSSETRSGDGIPTPVLIADLDGDGLAEILVRVDAVDRPQRRLYCFEGDGRLRFVHQPVGSRRFGDDDYGEPWLVHQAFVTRRPDGSRRLWAVFTHNLMFPSVLEELDAHGTVRQEYWSDGFIDFVAETSWRGRPVVLVGATNNDFRAASLAVFPPEGVKGAAPAARPAYACRDCPSGGPEAFFVFPSLCTIRRTGQAGILEAWVEGGDRIRVTAQQGGAGTGATFYTLGPDGSVLQAEVSREFQARHALLERQGVLDHPFGPRDDRDMFPVRRWDGRRFVDLPRVAVVH